MSRLNYLVRDPISFVGGPWRATADLVRGLIAKKNIMNGSGVNIGLRLYSLPMRAEFTQ